MGYNFDKINQFGCESEELVVKSLLEYLLPIVKDKTSSINNKASKIVTYAKKITKFINPIDSLLQEYKLNSKEGTILLCLAEALLRIPDKKTIDRLLEDKFTSADWKDHTGLDKGIYVNASSWAFFLTGKILDKNEIEKQHLEETYKSFLKRISEPIFRVAVKKTVMILANQFVFKPSIEEGIKYEGNVKYKNNLFSFDMLGEGARTKKDAEKYFIDYQKAIHHVGETANKELSIQERNGVSIKLSALHPRYERNNFQALELELLPKLIDLSLLAKQYDIQLCIDAEENYRLILSLMLLDKLSSNSQLKGWNGLGLAIQAYQKRAFYVIDWIDHIAQRDNRVMNVRLAKGAYWDNEIKIAQELGIDHYPVFTRKSLTDISWMACALKLFAMQDNIFPQFATHNAHSIAFIEEFGKGKQFEFQLVHGMAEQINGYFNQQDKNTYPKCRIYAPVGAYEDLLPYLMRRLLENGANTSFINKLNDPKLTIEEVIDDPVDIVSKYSQFSNPKIPLPTDIFLPERKNSKGYDLESEHTRLKIKNIFFQDHNYFMACPIVNGEDIRETSHQIYNPSNTDELLGEVSFANDNTINQAVVSAAKYFLHWKNVSIEEKVKIIQKYADLLEENQERLLYICVKEAGKTIKDAINDIREAIDFCHYYSNQALKIFSKPVELKGPTGEENKLFYEGKGVYFAISPWNFPIAIFLGQILAPLLAGNTLVAKPAEQTSVVSYELIKLLFKAGLPPEALQLLLGDGKKIADLVLNNENIKGVVFTGSCKTANEIKKTLNNKDGEIISLTAETGGLNFMIVDSSALIEQVVDDVIESGFHSAGQRCSALRVLAIQDDIYDKTVAMLQGAIQEIKVGYPQDLTSDVGPVIDQEAKNKITNHIKTFEKNILSQTIIQKELRGFYVAPTLIEINDLSKIKEEIFGPVIHVYRYQANQLETLVYDINQLNYGLTLGIQSRIENTINYIFNNANVGNIYINRNIVGAVVGLQPFGGRGLSGTGPKAGGPNYLLKFANEKVFTYNTTAAGGNASLLMLDEN